MKKEMRLKAIEDLKKEFETLGKINTWYKIYNLIDTDYIVNDMDVYEINNTNYSKSMINEWTSHTEETKHYSFYVELVKIVNNKVISEWATIEHEEKDLLIKLYEILQG